MEPLAHVTKALDGAHKRMLVDLQGLSRQQLGWRPIPHANHIAFVAWHTYRYQDSLLGQLQERPLLWDSQGWQQRLGVDLESAGVGFTEEQVGGFPVPDPAQFTSYLESVNQDTMSFLNSLKPQDMARETHINNWTRDLGEALFFLWGHNAQHQAHVDYIRGLMDSSWREARA